MQAEAGHFVERCQQFSNIGAGRDKCVVLYFDGNSDPVLDNEHINAVVVDAAGRKHLDVEAGTGFTPDCCIFLEADLAVAVVIEVQQCFWHRHLWNKFVLRHRASGVEYDVMGKAGWFFVLGCCQRGSQRSKGRGAQRGSKTAQEVPSVKQPVFVLHKTLDRKNMALSKQYISRSGAQRRNRTTDTGIFNTHFSKVPIYIK